jgi:hypothetical protein
MAEERKQGKARLGKRVWLYVGGLAGLVAIVALLIQGIDLISNWRANKAQDAAQATVVGIMDAQLRVQSEMATLQANGVRSGPTATVISGRVAELESTLDALQELQRSAEATLTAGAPRASSPDLTTAPQLRKPSQVAGVSAELLELSRFENTVTVKIRLVNSGQEDQQLAGTNGSYLLDEATQKRFYPSAHSNNTSRVSVPAGGSIEIWAKYSLLPTQHPQYLTVVLEQGILFEHIPMR